MIRLKYTRRKDNKNNEAMSYY